MAKKKIEISGNDYAAVEKTIVEIPISPITEHFNIGDLNTLRDKINEIIKKL